MGKFVFALVLLALSALAHAEEAKTLVGLVPEAQVPEAVSEMIESVTREKRQADEEAVDDEEDEAIEVEEGDDYEEAEEEEEEADYDEEEADDDSDYVDEDEETSADEWQPVEDPAEDAPAK